jgi:2-polyprenyl-6-hydroxyphenyl methylase / 3-demethylubiquinone-9 3-methyltransferase
MERPIMANTTYKTASSVDPAEMSHFAKMAEDWWNPSGKFKPLHIMNGCRVGYIKEEICAHFLRDPDVNLPLKGLRILDVGCGGGLLCEPMSRLGADVTGVDALEKNIKAAQIHAQSSGLEIDYIYTSVEALLESGQKPYDIVLNMEVLEHVTDPAEFIETCARLVRNGGLMFCSTINRTAKAFTLAIMGAEYIMNWLPRGTHQYAKFIKPAELLRALKDAGLTPDEPSGMVYNPLAGSWKITDDTSVNYLVRSLREGVKS